MATTLRRVVGGFLLGLFVCTDAFAQLLSSPSRTLCRQWDDVYLSAFETSLVVCTVATLVLGLLAGLLGRWSWIAAAPRLRILVTGLLVVTLVELGIVALPWIVGFGWLWFSAIDTRYFDCIPVRFGAQGLFRGLIGSDVAAIEQWPTLTYLLLLAAAVAGLLALLISEFVAASFGLRLRARREGA
jgi:hypothetical protein